MGEGSEDVAEQKTFPYLVVRRTLLHLLLLHAWLS